MLVITLAIGPQRVLETITSLQTTIASRLPDVDHAAACYLVHSSSAVQPLHASSDACPVCVF